jgi:hypothetical protein
MNILCPNCGADSSVRRGHARPATFRVCTNGHWFPAPTGPVCECGNAKASKRAKGCDRCMAIDHERYNAETARTQILRFLARNDWAATVDVLDAVTTAARQESSAVLARLINEGLVEKRRVVGSFFEYRLVQRRAA